MHYATAREFLETVQQRYRSLAGHADHGDGASGSATHSVLTPAVAHAIGALIFTESGDFQLGGLRRLRFRRLRVVDGVLCRAISGLHPEGGRITAWFGAEDLLLRRLQQHGNIQRHLLTATMSANQSETLS